jgi:superfamily I DNA/RNA helicase
VLSFLKELGKERLLALSADYESSAWLNDVIAKTKSKIYELLSIEPDVVKALGLLTDDRAVRIMTIHKSKGLEFDSIVILGVEQETFWGDADDERCAFFVGVSRAKRRLLLTFANTRPRPEGFARRWTESRTLHNEFIGYAQQFCS